MSPDKVRGAYYFPQWPAVHKAFNDAVTKAVTGKREDIAKVLADNARWSARRRRGSRSDALRSLMFLSPARGRG